MEPPVTEGGNVSGSGFRTSVEGRGVAMVTLDRPQSLNAMTQAMKRDLIEWLTAAQVDPAIRVVVFTGAGGAFCAGDDLAEYHRDDPVTVARIGPGHDGPMGTVNGLAAYSQALNLAVRRLNKVTIAAIDGPAIQTGLSLALATDLRYASTRARLGSATLRFGLLPDEGGHWLLVEQLGRAGALEFILRRRIVDADEALALGLVNGVVEPARLIEQVLAIADEIATGPQTAIQMLKRAIHVAAESTFEVALADIAARTAVTDHHPDAREGVAAFLEKRAPKFE